MPHKYITDGSYKYVGTKPTKAGQKVIYHTYQGPQHIIDHSGIVDSIKGKTVTIRSKWGAMPLMRHSVDYSPYSKNSVTKKSNSIAYYKR